MLSVGAQWFVYRLLGLDRASKPAQMLEFFLYDAAKILLLLFVLVSVVGFLRTFLPAQRIKRWVSGKGLLGNFAAALFGAVTPFCSCSSIPIFFSFLRAGIPAGIAFSFLITSPIINEYLVVLMLGFFGPRITLAYVLSGLFIGTSAGAVIGRFSLRRHLVEDMLPDAAAAESSPAAFRDLRDRMRYGLHEAVTIVRQVWLWVLIGVGVGALIHNLVPQESIEKIISKVGFFSVPIATLIGVPLYGSCAAIVPIAVVLFQKGFPLGTALSFMMAVAALSLPEAVLLRRALKLPLIVLFFCITTFSIILLGYLFNFLQRFL